MIAIIKTGGKQYVVKEGDTLDVEKLASEGASVSFGEVLLVASEDGATLTMGTPNVSGATVSASVVSEGRTKKIDVIKYKPKVRYRKKTGHRQAYTRVKIEKISA
ncbi:MAG: 50S ribosomal protein L21 [Parcubacteria group bacterium]|nr:50S ribosomal protein L21 [Parcubacteria group bacterium]